MFKLSILIFLSIAWAADAAMRLDTKDGEYPYQASLQRKEAPAYYFCSGTIISSKWILTAANCFDRFRTGINDIKVGVGSISLRAATFYLVEQIIIHENYDEIYLDNNIALVKLASELILNSNVAPIDLASMDTPPGTNCTLTGWGPYISNPRNPYNLKVTFLNTINQSDCRRCFRMGYVNTDVAERQLSGERDEPFGACQIEAGGPLAVNNEVVGIISCSGRDIYRSREYPYIFTKVFAYLDWISNKINS
ncbi:unnamed protein product [Colias eurytheme]|nr:unnamed protein product [Colias eurytheme]